MEVLLFWLILAAIPAWIAGQFRGRRPAVWFVLGLLFSPIVTLLFVLMLPTKANKAVAA